MVKELSSRLGCTQTEKPPYNQYMAGGNQRQPESGE